jgi:hypothetical protein
MGAAVEVGQSLPVCPNKLSISKAQPHFSPLTAPRRHPFSVLGSVSKANGRGTLPIKRLRLRPRSSQRQGTITARGRHLRSDAEDGNYAADLDAPAIDHWMKRTQVGRGNGNLIFNNTLELIEYGRKKQASLRLAASPEVAVTTTNRPPTTWPSSGLLQPGCGCALMSPCPGSSNGPPVSASFFGTWIQTRTNRVQRLLCYDTG